MRKQSGFSLIELLLVVAIILIIVAVAVPNFLLSRMSANESSAVASLHNIANAEVAYYTTYPTLGFAPDLNTLGPGGVTCAEATATNACLLDNVLGCTAGVLTASCQKSGYNFYITAGSGTANTTYSLNANPIVLGQNGQRFFYTDISGVIRYNTTVIATSADQPLN